MMEVADKQNEEFTQAITANVTRRWEDLSIGVWSGGSAVVFAYVVASFAFAMSPLDGFAKVIGIAAFAVALGFVWIVKAELQEIADATAVLDQTAVKALSERTDHLSDASKELIRAGWVSSALAYHAAVSGEPADRGRIVSRVALRFFVLVAPPTVGWLFSA